MSLVFNMMFQRVPARDQEVAEVLMSYRKETVYACVFPCIYCAQAHLSLDVVPAAKVENLSTLAGLARYALEEHVRGARFLCLGELWCCRTCKRDLDADRCQCLMKN